MKLRRLLCHFAFILMALTVVQAQDAAADLKALVQKITTKLSAGQRSAAQLQSELAEFDALAAKYQDPKSEDAAQIALMRATLYLQVLDDEAKGKELLARVKTDYPGTAVAAEVDRALAAIEQQQKAKEAQVGIVGKPAPELHFKWSSRPGLQKLSDLKGKVVVIDFWATWCGPCIRSFPQVRELARHYRDSDVVVLGVTSLQGRVANLESGPIDTQGNPGKELSLMPAFMKAKDMTWTLAVSDEPVFNPEYGITGIPHMTIIAPDGTVRHNDLHPAMPEAEKTEKIDAILKEFGLKIPGPVAAL